MRAGWIVWAAALVAVCGAGLLAAYWLFVQMLRVFEAVGFLR